MTILFGIHNCDTVKKAKKWLDSQPLDYRYHDFRSDGITAKQVDEWLAQVPASTLINKRSTTWKKLPEELREQLSTADIDNANAALKKVIISTLVEQPTLIKRPVLETENGDLLVGFSENSYQALV